MKRPWSRKTYIVLSLGVIVLTNLVMLSGVAWNRSGEADSQLRLGLRELASVPSEFNSDVSGLNLRLSWRVPIHEGKKLALSMYGWNFPVWLNQDKMQTLGFELPSGDHDKLPRSTSRDVFVVLENAGSAWGDHMQRVQEEFDHRIARAERMDDERLRKAELDFARDWLQRESNGASRLFAIDAGLDAGALRQRYVDRSQYAIVRGRVMSSFERVNKKIVMSGSLQEISASTINIPYAYRATLLTAAEQTSMSVEARKSFKDAEFVVAFGRCLEPWLMSIDHPTPNATTTEPSVAAPAGQD